MAGRPRLMLLSIVNSLGLAAKDFLLHDGRYEMVPDRVAFIYFLDTPFAVFYHVAGDYSMLSAPSSTRVDNEIIVRWVD